MKQKSKIVTATAIAILSLMIMATDPGCGFSTQSPHSKSDETPQVSYRVVTPPLSVECQLSQILPMENDQNGTQKEPISQVVTEPPIAEPLPIETAPTQPTEKEMSDTTHIEDTQTATKPSAQSPTEPATQKMGDTRIVDGKQQSYFLGFGWVDYMGENECIYEPGMYENGNKVGIMGISDGNINKIVGIMD